MQIQYDMNVFFFHADNVRVCASEGRKGRESSVETKTQQGLSN